MADAAFLAIGPWHLMHVVPLLAAVSFVYSATRHESTDDILRGARQSAFTFGGFLVGIFLVLALLSWVV